MLEKRAEVGAIGAEVGSDTGGEPVVITIRLDQTEGAESADHLAGRKRIEPEFGGDRQSGVAGRSASASRIPVRPATVMTRWPAKLHSSR